MSSPQDLARAAREQDLGSNDAGADECSAESTLRGGNALSRVHQVLERAPELDGGFENLGSVEDTLYWWRRHREGDRDAINRLLDRYHDRLLRIVRLRMSEWLRRKTDPEEIVNKTFVTAWTNLDRFEMRDHSSFLLWLDRIAQRKITDCVDYWRQQKRDESRNVSIDHVDADGERAGPEIVDHGPSPSSYHIRAECKRIYDECVAALPEDARNVVLLREYVGCSAEETAMRLGKPTAHAVEEAHRRARLKLAACLKRKLGPR
jgi:RNA polymerase sigma-70 factor (ECF subfamily)